MRNSCSMPLNNLNFFKQLNCPEFHVTEFQFAAPICYVVCMSTSYLYTINF